MLSAWSPTETELPQTCKNELSTKNVIGSAWRANHSKRHAIALVNLDGPVVGHNGGEQHRPDTAKMPKKIQKIFLHQLAKCHRFSLREWLNIFAFALRVGWGMGFRMGRAFAVYTTCHELSRLSMAVPKHQPLHPPLPKGTVEWVLWNAFLVSNVFFLLFYILFLLVKWFGFQIGISHSSKFIEVANSRRPNSWAAWCDGQWLGLRFFCVSSVSALCQLVWRRSRAILFNGIAFFRFFLLCQLRIQNDSFESQCTAPWSTLIHLNPSWSILILTVSTVSLLGDSRSAGGQVESERTSTDWVDVDSWVMLSP